MTVSMLSFRKVTFYIDKGTTMNIKDIPISQDTGCGCNSKISDDLTFRRTLLFVTYSIIPVVFLYYFTPFLAEATINTVLSVGLDLKYSILFQHLLAWVIFWGAVTVQRDLYQGFRRMYCGVKSLINKKGQ